MTRRPRHAPLGSLAARLAALLFALVALGPLAGCRATTPMIDEIPAGDPLPIDGLWLDTTNGLRLQVGGGRVWATEPFMAGIWKVRTGQVQGINLHRTGPRKFEGWHPGFAGPFYYYVQDNGQIAVLLETAFFGDHQAILQRVSVDDPAAFAAEQSGASPGLPWQDAALLAGAAPAPPRASVAPVPPAAVAPSPDVPAPQPGSFGDPGDIDFGSYHALLIGNNGYQYLPRLLSAESDVEAISQLLKDRYGFQTTILEDASRDDLLLALERMRRELTDRDNLLIYYAGHGWLDEEADEGYWLPVDATEDSTINWIPNATLTSALKAIRAKHVLVVADSCYSGKLTRGIAVRGNRTPDYVRRMAEKRARMVISSGGLEPVLDGGHGKHSVFAGAFLTALRENQEIVDTTSLFSRIRRDVMLQADQTPELADIRKSGHDGGDFLFVPKD
jgi:hypothetical protein